MSSSIIASTMGILALMMLMISPSISPASSSSPPLSDPQADNSSNNEWGLLTTDSMPYGLTYGEWTARWWQWAYSIPKDAHPAYDASGQYCGEGQSGPVWFLAGTYKHPAERDCTIPAGKAILLPILNSECSYAEFPDLNNEEELRNCAKQMQDSIIHLEASIDGVSIPGLERYRVQSPIFNLTVGQNNILDLPANTTTPAVSDGNWLFLKPLSPGEHVIYFKGGLATRSATNTSTTTTPNNNATTDPFAAPIGWDEPVTYHIKITNNSSTSATTAYTNQTDAEIMEHGDSIASILADELETSINKSAAILEITSKSPEVKSTPFASSIHPELHGIPKDLDMPKRKVAQDILAVDKAFQVVFFLMPNGDVYFIEPYSQQQNLTGNNFAFREYYKGAIDTHNTYLSNVIISAASGRPQTNIAVPIYSENDGTLVGLWSGGLNVTMLSKSLQPLNLTNSERVVYVDQHGQKISDSNSNSKSLSSPNSSNESFAHLQSFQNAINDESGTMVEIVNGTKMVVSYHPVKVFSTIWTVLYMRPYNE